MNTSAISIDQFRSEVHSHRQRVYHKAKRILEEFISNFAGLSALSESFRHSIFHSYMVLHDVPKLMTHAQLCDWSYKGEQSILELLHSIYGVQVTGRPGFLDDLNSIEAEMKNSMIDMKFSHIEKNLRMQIIGELQYIEWIADISDTMQTRGPELGVQFDPEAHKEYFSKKNDPNAVDIAHWLHQQETQG